jgi:hypothetical protein
MKTMEKLKVKSGKFLSLIVGIGAGVATLYYTAGAAYASSVQATGTLANLATSAQSTGGGISKVALELGIGVAAVGVVSTFIKYNMNHDHNTAKKEAIGMLVGTAGLSLIIGYITQKMTAVGALVGYAHTSAKVIAALHGMRF